MSVGAGNQLALTHGHRAGGNWSPTYNSWRAMIARCRYSAHPCYADYGGRGITVADEWTGRGGFARFLADVGPRPSSDHTLDRIDVNGAYEPGNVRWADRITQRWNRRDMVARRAAGALWTDPEPVEMCEACSDQLDRERIPF